MRAAVIQLKASDDKQKNIRQALTLTQKAIRKGAKFILLPEVFVFRGELKKEQIKGVAEKIPGDSLKPFIHLARSKKVFILAGSIYERSESAGKVYNTSVLIDPRGKVAAKYRKINMFNAVIGRKRIRETDTFKAGQSLATAKVGEFIIGLTICYDLRFSLLYKKYARKGVNVFCVPSAFTKQTGEAHWSTLIRARAIENRAYVLAPNQYGKDSKGIVNYGHSMIVDPWGRVLAEASADKDQILLADIQLKKIKDIRKILPTFN